MKGTLWLRWEDPMKAVRAPHCRAELFRASMKCNVYNAMTSVISEMYTVCICINLVVGTGHTYDSIQKQRKKEIARFVARPTVVFNNNNDNNVNRTNWQPTVYILCHNNNNKNSNDNDNDDGLADSRFGTYQPVPLFRWWVCLFVLIRVWVVDVMLCRIGHKFAFVVWNVLDCSCIVCYTA